MSSDGNSRLVGVENWLSSHSDQDSISVVIKYITEYFVFKDISTILRVCSTKDRLIATLGHTRGDYKYRVMFLTICQLSSNNVEPSIGNKLRIFLELCPVTFMRWLRCVPGGFQGHSHYVSHSYSYSYQDPQCTPIPGGSYLWIWLIFYNLMFLSNLTLVTHQFQSYICCVVQ